MSRVEPLTETASENMAVKKCCEANRLSLPMFHNVPLPLWTCSVCPQGSSIETESILRRFALCKDNAHKWRSRPNLCKLVLSSYPSPMTKRESTAAFRKYGPIWCRAGRGSADIIKELGPSWRSRIAGPACAEGSNVLELGFREPQREMLLQDARKGGPCSSGNC